MSSHSTQQEVVDRSEKEIGYRAVSGGCGDREQFAVPGNSQRQRSIKR